MRIFITIIFLSSFLISFSIYSQSTKTDRLYGVYISPKSDPFDENSRVYIVINNKKIKVYENFKINEEKESEIELRDEKLCIEEICCNFSINDNGDLIISLDEVTDVLFFKKIY